MGDYVRDFYYSISMKKKWAIFIFILIVYPIILLGYFGYKNYERMIGDYFIENVQKEVRSITQRVSEHFEDLEIFIKKLQYDEYIYGFMQEKQYSIMKNKNNIIAYNSVPDYEFKRAVEQHLDSILISRPEFNLVSIKFLNEPDKIYSVNKTKSYIEDSKFTKMDIYDWSQEQKASTLYYLDRENSLYIIQKIINRRNLEHESTMIFKMDAAIFFDKLESILEGAKKGIYVVGLDNREMLRCGEVPTEYRLRVLDYYKDGLASNLYLGENPKKEFIVYDYIETDNLKMGVAVLIFTDILLDDIRTLSGRIILLSLSTVPIFLLLGYQLYKDVIHPIYELVNKMKQIENGEMGVLLNSDRKDEMGVVFRSFNQMSNQIEFLVNKVYKEQIAFKNSEIKALQAQINPHFLYNTLEIINWSARMSGADEVADMIEALAGIMEVNIDRKDERFLTVEDELKYTNHYIFLIKKRFGDNIIFSEHIDSNTKNLKVPRLILQPIIENAIEHGIGPTGKGVVTLRIYLEEHILIIEVEDNGQGIPDESLIILQYNLDNWNRLETQKDSFENKGKIGVLNVHSRLKLIYGEESGIQVTSKYTKGTLIRIKVPINTTEASQKGEA